MSVRLKGLLQLLASGFIFAVGLYWFAQQRAADANYELPGGMFGMLLIIVPGGFALAGLMQLASGVPFSELSGRWDALKGWQRGLIGVTTFALGLALLFGGLLVYGYITAGS